MPFIIRGVSLLGISSANCPIELRREIWQQLGDEWKPNHLDKIATREIGLDGLPAVFDEMLAGETVGRTLVRIGE